MTKVVRSDERHLVENETIKGYWLFSYSDYLDMQNTHFGGLKVFNDEILKNGKFYKPESVNDKEIVTIVLEGELNHEDSTGTKEVLKAGNVQVLSSGSGVTFTDMNMSGKDTRICRIWIEPLMQNMKPACRQENFDIDSRKNELVTVAGQGYPGAVKLRANSSIHMSKLDSGKKIEVLTDISRCVFIYVLEGEITSCGENLEKNDQIRINQNENIVIEANSDAYFILVDATGGY